MFLEGARDSKRRLRRQCEILKRVVKNIEQVTSQLLTQFPVKFK